MTEPTSYLYILTNAMRSALYIGVTSNLKRRLWEHINDLSPGFSSRYKTKTLVYFEVFNSIEEAISREKQLKDWNRAKKKTLIERTNPEWKPLNVQALSD